MMVQESVPSVFLLLREKKSCKVGACFVFSRKGRGVCVGGYFLVYYFEMRTA